MLIFHYCTVHKYEELYHTVILWWFEQNLLIHQTWRHYCKIFKNFMESYLTCTCFWTLKGVAKALLLFPWQRIAFVVEWRARGHIIVLQSVSRKYSSGKRELMFCSALHVPPTLNFPFPGRCFTESKFKFKKNFKNLLKHTWSHPKKLYVN